MVGRIVSFTLLGLIGLWAAPAMAYIDPGSGSAIMSAVIGLFVAVGLWFKTYWYKLKSFFLGSKSTVEQTETTEDGENKPKK